MQKSTTSAAVAQSPESSEVHSYRLTLVSFPPARKAAVVKAIRNLTGLDLFEAKRLAENVPTVIATTAATRARSKALYELDMTGAVVRVKKVEPAEPSAPPVSSLSSQHRRVSRLHQVRGRAARDQQRSR